MITLLAVLLVLALLLIVALFIAGAVIIRERDEWEAFAMSLMEESTDPAAVTR